jgi:hypothetical protein
LTRDGIVSKVPHPSRTLEQGEKFQQPAGHLHGSKCSYLLAICRHRTRSKPERASSYRKNKPFDNPEENKELFKKNVAGNSAFSEHDPEAGHSHDQQGHDIETSPKQATNRDGDVMIDITSLIERQNNSSSISDNIFSTSIQHGITPRRSPMDSILNKSASNTSQCLPDT